MTYVEVYYYVYEDIFTYEFLALSMVYEKAHSVLTATVDAPNWIHKYIIGRKGANIRRFTQDLTKVF
jgi:ribosomal protein S3